MFWAKRRETQRHNKVILDSYNGWKLHHLLVECHERLEAIDPDYRINSLFVALYRTNAPTQLIYEFIPSKYATQQDMEMMFIIVAHTESEIDKEYGR